METQFNNTSILEIFQDENNNSVLTKEQIYITDDVLTVKNGFGSCKACSCTGYKANDPKNDYCRTCGHHWTQHR